MYIFMLDFWEMYSMFKIEYKITDLSKYDFLKDNMDFLNLFVMKIHMVWC